MPTSVHLMLSSLFFGGAVYLASKRDWHGGGTEDDLAWLKLSVGVAQVDTMSHGSLSPVKRPACHA